MRGPEANKRRIRDEGEESDESAGNRGRKGKDRTSRISDNKTG